MGKNALAYYTEVEINELKNYSIGGGKNVIRKWNDFIGRKRWRQNIQQNDI